MLRIKEGRTTFFSEFGSKNKIKKIVSIFLRFLTNPPKSARKNPKNSATSRQNCGLRGTLKINCWKKETEGKWEKKKREIRGKKKEGKRKKKRGKKEKKRNYVRFRTIQNTATQWAVGARSANDVRTAAEENFRYAAEKPTADPGTINFRFIIKHEGREFDFFQGKFLEKIFFR